MRSALAGLAVTLGGALALSQVFRVEAVPGLFLLGLTVALLGACLSGRSA